eukprot:CAMPEP_0176003946 /NCGR_PEP_ID=MMETSP0120_2-20121206/1436_1 /TAXON_ID=160619 /ORGANISM="Kryptoperidinium foliaceum, Strain CCMP 1326" /LENGTH=884 /DNA_ID=CAMNT_0017336605 /DNA_START=9 /DNA_END=2663 /DNA_ORIENTATION=-
MAGTWRISLDRLEDLTKSSLVDVAKSALNALNRRSSTGYEHEDVFFNQVLFEVVSSQSVQRTKPCEVSDDGSARINRVFFVPAPAPDGAVVIRLIKTHRLLQDTLIGEARIAQPAGTMNVAVLRKGKFRATLHVGVTSGLPMPIASGDATATSSTASKRAFLKQSMASGSSEIFAAPSVASSSTSTTKPALLKQSMVSGSSDIFAAQPVAGASAAPSASPPAVQGADSASGEQRRGFEEGPSQLSPRSGTSMPPTSSPPVAAQIFPASPAKSAHSQAQAATPPVSPQRPALLDDRSPAQALQVPQSAMAVVTPVPSPAAGGSAAAALPSAAFVPASAPAVYSVDTRKLAVGDVTVSPAAYTPMSQANSVKSGKVGGGTSRSAGRRGTGGRNKSFDPYGPRRLRKRPPNLPVIGTCDVVITGITDLAELRNPYLIVGIEGQEFSVTSLDSIGTSERGDCSYTFSIGSVQSSVQVYLCDDFHGPHMVKGRVLVPLNDVVWPSRGSLDMSRVRAGFERETEPYRRKYAMCFLPPSEHGDGGPGDVAFWDSYNFAALDDGATGAQGVLHMELEITLCSEAQPLLAFYAKSVVAGMHRVMALGTEGGPSRARNRYRSLRPIPALSEWSDPGMIMGAKDLLQSPEFQSVMQSLERWHRNAAAEPAGILRWVRQKTSNSYIAAGSWFMFCFAGFFPCSLWLLPIYAWCLFVGNGLLAAGQRHEDLASTGVDSDDEEEGHRIVAAGPFPALGVPGVVDGTRSASSHIARWQKVIYLAEPLLLTAVAFRARFRNLLGFYDGPASVANFAIMGLLAVGLSAYLLLISAIDPSLNFMCGLYGAIALVAYSRAGGLVGKCEPLWGQWAFNEIFACAPDDLQAVHRFVSTRVQSLDP